METDITVKYAGFWLRTAAFILDGIILYIPRTIIYWLSIASNISPNPEQTGALVNLLITWAYFAILPSCPLQATLGMKICGLRVCDYDYQKISFSKSALRSIGMFVSVIILMVGCIIVAFTQKKQALHDFMTKTYVIKAK